MASASRRAKCAISPHIVFTERMKPDAVRWMFIIIEIKGSSSLTLYYIIQPLSVTLMAGPVAGMSSPSVTDSTGSGGLLLSYHRTFTATLHLWTTPPTAQKVKGQVFLSEILFFKLPSVVFKKNFVGKYYF